MQKLFSPESLLVVGVSPSPRNMGRYIVDNLIRHQFKGRMFLMGQQEGAWAGHPIVTDFSMVPEGVELAIVLTPANLVPGVLEECGRKGIRHVIIESGGFTELGEHRRALEEQTLETARRWGIRFAGPNGLGIVDTGSGLATPFVPLVESLPKGRLSMLSQSGGVGVAMMLGLRRLNLGLDKFVSMGNKFSLDEVDFLEYLSTTNSCDTVCCYLEGMSRPRRFFEVAARFPGRIVLIKANTSQAGARAASTHTASLTTDDRLVDAGARWAGVTRTHSLTAMMEIAKVLAHPRVKGRRLLLLSRSGGHAVLAADAAERLGFELPPVPETIAALAYEGARAQVIKTNNPLDLGDIFDFSVYGRMMEEAARCGLYDAAVLIHAFSGKGEMGASLPMVKHLGTVVKEAAIPLFLACVTEPESFNQLQQAYPRPMFETPEGLLDALYRVAQAELARTQLETPEPEDTHHIRAVQELLGSFGQNDWETDDGWLRPSSAYRLLQAAGIPATPFVAAEDAARVVEASAALAYPRVAKLVTSRLVHKAAGGGVILGIRTPEELTAACESLEKAATELGASKGEYELLVQSQVTSGVEIFVGGKVDPEFGPVVLLGAGGSDVEWLGDVVSSLAPLTAAQARDMVQRVRRLSHKPERMDVEAAAAYVLAVALLLRQVPGIEEIDVNPIRLLPPGKGGMAVDVRIKMRPGKG